MRNYPWEFARLICRMRVEQLVFHTSIKLLLSGCIDEAVLVNLLDDADGDKWSDPSVDAAVRKQMQGSYGLYLETVRGMQMTLEQFRKRLKLSPDGKRPVHTSGLFKEAFKRVEFALKKAEYVDLLDELSRDNASLSKLAEQSKLQSSQRRIPNFSQMRAHASSIFSTLQKCLHRSCQVAHRASVCIRDTNGDSSEQEEPTCRVVLHHVGTPTSAAQPQLWSLEEIELRLVKSVVNAPTNTPLQGSPGSSRPPVQVSKVQSGIPPSARAPPPSGLANLAEIHDLCLSFERLRTIQRGKCLGYLVDATMERHALYWPEKPLIDKKTLPVVSLTDVLAASKSNAQLSGGDARRLAAALAFGMLRLHDTPWLTKEWNHADITFFEKDGALLTDHPFISTDMRAQSALQRQPSPAQTPHNPSIHNQTVFALGILLIELCLETSFHDLQKSAGDLNPDGSKDVVSDVTTANRLLDEVYGKFGELYGDAVRRCIRCEFNQRQTSLEDDAFRRAVYEKVVVVLDEEVEHFFKPNV